MFYFPAFLVGKFWFSPRLVGGQNGHEVHRDGVKIASSHQTPPAMAKVAPSGQNGNIFSPKLKWSIPPGQWPMWDIVTRVWTIVLHLYLCFSPLCCTGTLLWAGIRWPRWICSCYPQGNLCRWGSFESLDFFYTNYNPVRSYYVWFCTATPLWSFLIKEICIIRSMYRVPFENDN